MLALLAKLQTDRRFGMAAVTALGALAGLLSAWLTPRGPVTGGEAVGTVMGALAVGAAAGYLSGRRLAMILLPVAFWLVLELARAGLSGPTVDGIHLGSMYGLIAFVVGRGLHLLLTLPALLLGIYGGTRLAAGRITRVGMVLNGVMGLAVLTLAVSFALPPRVTPILGPEGEILSGSISEIIRIPLGGHDQVLMIRGRNLENPVLLYLAGGPGGTDLGAMRADVSLEQDFVVVTWEQRGVGKSYPALDPTGTLTLEQTIADTLELTEYLRERFDEDKIYLVGNSWGSLLGALAAERRPQWYHAFVGTGQMVSPTETDRMFYEDTMAWAEQTGRNDLVETLRKNGPPPYDDLLQYEPALAHEHDWNAYPELDVGKEMPANLMVPENALMDRVNGLRSFLDTFATLYPQLRGIDFRKDLIHLEVPAYVVLGAHEARGRAVPAREWHDLLKAPHKELIVFEHSGHRPHFEQPGRFAELMRRVASETYPADR